MAGQSYYKGNIFTHHRSAFNTAALLVRVYYWAIVFIIAIFVKEWIERLTAVPTDLQWPSLGLN